MSRKDKKSIKRQQKEADKQDFAGDIGDIRDFDDLIALSGNNETAGKVTNKSGRKESQVNTAAALKKAITAFSNDHSNSNNYSDNDDYDDVDNNFEEMLNNHDENERKRRRAPIDDGDDSGNLVEDFSKKKKDFVKLKKEHYTIAPKIGGRDEVVEPGKKRAATHEIIANRGLTPHRKKENKNPRVKKRHAYEKAVVARKGQVRDIISGAEGAYGGELTGIKANLSRSRRLES
jgi:U3 small nucleolar RNA-associated protein 3